jgi:hypothetical protein
MNQDVIQSFSKFIGELSFKSWWILTTVVIFPGLF